jgi:kynureninase
VIERARAEELDRADPLAPFRARFVTGDEPRIYADGNSLGRLPRDTVARVGALVRDWGDRLVSGWADWIELPVRVGDLLAQLLGARSGEVLACDSTTVNLYKLAHAALDLRAGAIVTDAGNFPTDRYVLEGVAAARGVELRRFEADPVEGPSAADVERALAPGDVALVCLSHVDFRSGALADMPAITALARDRRAAVVWDVSHSAGAVPVDLAGSGAELAVGCTYKYLNAGPGAPAFLYVRRELQERLRSPVQGWFGARDQFAMGPRYEPAEGIERFHAGTPPVLGLAGVQAGVELALEAGTQPVRRKSEALTELTVALADERLASLGFRLASPRDPARRGGHVSLAHDDGWRICRALIERADVVPDFRPPNAVRLAFPPLYSRFVDVWDAIDRMATLVESQVHLEVDASPRRVT